MGWFVGLLVTVWILRSLLQNRRDEQVAPFELAASDTDAEAKFAAAVSRGRELRWQAHQRYVATTMYRKLDAGFRSRYDSACEELDALEGDAEEDGSTEVLELANSKRAEVEQLRLEAHAWFVRLSQAEQNATKIEFAAWVRPLEKPPSLSNNWPPELDSARGRASLTRLYEGLAEVERREYGRTFISKEIVRAIDEKTQHGFDWSPLGGVPFSAAHPDGHPRLVAAARDCLREKMEQAWYELGR